MFGPMLASTAVLSLLVTMAVAQPVSRSIAKVQRVTEGDFADPSLIHVGNIWYSFATGNNNGINVQVSTSTDFKSWTLLKHLDAMHTVGAWADQASPSVWAPDVIKNDAGKFVLYYSARVAGNAKYHCIGAATSKSVLGPYTAQASPLACDTSKGGAIDPSGFRDANGDRYVIYKIDGNSNGHGGTCNNMVAPIVPTPIMLQRVKADGFTKHGSPIAILNRDSRDGPLIEAPSMMRTSDGKYVLFFSSNCYSTTLYDVSYAMADSISGPFDKYGPLFVTGTAGLTAPGGASVAVDGKHMVFHANNGNLRSMFTTIISVDTKKHIVSTV